MRTAACSAGWKIAVLPALLLWPIAGTAWGGAIEDARKLAEEKKYDEVDKALEKVLAQKEVPVEALRLSLEAAVARGRAITAQQRVTALLKATQNQDLALVYLGAGVAEQVGDDRLALGRYLAYAKGATAKDEKTEHALRYVLWRGAYPEEYQKYVSLFGKTDLSWDLGQRQVSALLAADETAQGLALAEGLLAQASHPAQVNHIHWLLWDAQEKGLLGADPEPRWLRPLQILLKHRPTNLSFVENFVVNRLWNWDKFPAEQRVELLFKVQDMWKGRLPWNILSRFGVFRDIPDEGKRLAAGKRYLAFEAAYKGDPDPNAFREYLHTVMESPQVFFIPGKELISTPDMHARFDGIKSKFAGDANVMNHFITHAAFSYTRDPNAQAEFLKKHLAVAPSDKAAWLVGAAKGENFDAFVAEACKGRDAGWISAFKGQLLPVLNQLGKKDALLAAAREWTQTNPGSFDWRHFQGHVMNSAALSLDEKLGLLRELVEKGGASPPLRGLVGELDKDKKNWSNQAPFQKLKQDLADAGKTGSDPLMRTHVILFSLPFNRNSPRKEYHDAAKQLLDGYKGPIPTGNWQQDALWGGVCWRHFEAVWDNRGEIEKAARLWSPRLDKGFGWNFMTQRVREHSSTELLYRLAQTYFEQIKDGPGDAWVWQNLSQATNPKTAKASLFAGLYEKMGPANAVSYLTRQSALEGQLVFDDLAKLAARPDFPFGNPNLPRELAQFVFQRVNNQQRPPVVLAQVLWKHFTALEERNRAYDPGAEAWICGLFTRAERWPEWPEHWKAYVPFIQKRPLAQQVQALACVNGVLPREKAGELTPGARIHALLKELKPRVEQLPPGEWPHLVFFQDLAEDLCEVLTRWPDGEAKQEARALARRAANMLVAGTRYEGRGAPLLGLLTLASNDALEQQDWLALSRVSQCLAGHLGSAEKWDETFRDVLQPLALKLKEKDAFEIGFVFLDQALKRNKVEENIAKQLAVWKAEFSRAIPDVLVQKGNPAYDLHAAARALALGGETRAWELTQPKLPLLKQLWAELEPGYVAWTVDQMRKQKMLKEALDLCFTILLRELDLDPEIAASVILVKGTTYSDMQNFQAARIEYEGLKNNRRYAKTEAGGKAKYRLIALLIQTKDYTRAEELLQLLVDSDNIETQAEAYFLFAKMAYDQQQYEEARKHLAEVFKRKMDHVEGKLLEGELRLLVRGGLASTEVEAGTPELGKVAIPGLPLSLKLQDQNLAISQGGAAVKVLVRTSKGGDEERINLHAAPGARDVFSATVPTMLGPIQKGDMTLQLRGDDVISYVIDPEYQKAHALNYAPKTLQVRFDPRLMASSGEILSEEEQEKRELERRQRAAETLESVRFLGRDERTVRPGSPIYAQVTDLAQDLSDQPDPVRVTIKTSSGDMLENVELRETGPHTGIFRGQIPTTIPRPRVTVSDSEEGKNPGVVIREGNQAAWSSLADGVRPKWLEVDTMSSHLVKSVALALPDPKQVRQVSLHGLLADEYAEIAAFPPRAALAGQGLRAEYYNQRDFRGPVVVNRIDPLLNYPGGSPAPKVNANNFSVRWTGRVVPAYTESYIFHTVSDDGVRLWIGRQLLVDNWTDHGPTENTGTVALQAGQPYDIKIEYYQGQGEGMFQLLWSSKSQRRELIPTGRLLPAGGALTLGSGTVRLSICSGVTSGSPDPEAMRGYLKTQPSSHVNVEQPVFDRADTPYRARAGWMTNRLAGAFFVAEPLECEFKFLQKPSPNAWQTVFFLLDGRVVLGGPVTAKNLSATKKESLSKGVHRLELLIQDHWENSQVILGWRKGGTGEFQPLPSSWFSEKEHPEIQPFLRRGQLEQTPTGFLATLTEPERLRKVKWVFEDFSGNAMAVKSVTVTDSKDGVVLPAKEAGEVAAKKQALEVAPGDQIEVSYGSERRLREDTPVLTSLLNSSFYNGTVLFANEIIVDDAEGNRRSIQYQPAKRCRAGDSLVVIVQDNDADLTDERDTVPVIVKTTAHGSLELKALETNPTNPEDEARCRHSGFFLATLKVGAQAGPDTVAVKPGDLLTVSYLDKENTNPGVPFERTYSVEEAGRSRPEVVVYRTRTEMVEDTSPEAKAKIERLKMRGVPSAGLVIHKARVVAQHPEALGAPAKEAAQEPVSADVGAPILFEVIYPRVAIHSGSILKAQAVAESEAQAAAKENRPPKALEVPLTIVPIEALAGSKGYPIQLQRPFPRTAKDMLQEGCFAGIIRLQIGSPGDPVDDLVLVGLGEFESREEINKGDSRYRIPTLLVSGSDMVHLKVKDEETGQLIAQDVKLLSDARLEVMDTTYTVPQDALHLGETLALRLTDPDHDLTNARDKVILNVKAASGSQVKLELTETLPHSGVFTGAIKPVFGGEGAAAGGPEGGLRVKFGDEIVFTFHDDRCLKAGGGGGMDVEKKARVHYGFDGELAAFSKVFADPEMAVKTRFLMAEALFEMAKEHRKLKQDDKAKDEIDRGKRILEEAMRDYPNTSLVAQGEFLLANLAQELGNPQEAVGRYSAVISQWPDSEYAVRSQFKMALCQEKMGNFDQACENYVRVIYIYPDSDLVSDAKIRLGNYYYKEKQYKVAAKIFSQFQKSAPAHPLAAKTLFLAAQCYIKVEEWKPAIEALDLLVAQYQDQKDVRAEAMYWLGDCYAKANDYRQAYRTFKRLTWDYPEGKWAKIARGRLTEEAFVQVETEEGSGNQ